MFVTRVCGYHFSSGSGPSGAASSTNSTAESKSDVNSSNKSRQKSGGDEGDEDEEEDEEEGEGTTNSSGSNGGSNIGGNIQSEKFKLPISHEGELKRSGHTKPVSCIDLDPTGTRYLFFFLSLAAFLDHW